MQLLHHFGIFHIRVDSIKIYRYRYNSINLNSDFQKAAVRFTCFVGNFFQCGIDQHVVYCSSHKRLSKCLFATDAFSSLGKIWNVQAQVITLLSFFSLMEIELTRTDRRSTFKCNGKHTIKIGHNFKYVTLTIEVQWALKSWAC